MQTTQVASKQVAFLRGTFPVGQDCLVGVETTSDWSGSAAGVQGHPSHMHAQLIHVHRVCQSVFVINVTSDTRPILDIFPLGV